MNFRQLLNQIIPPPRAEWRPTALLPLVVIGLCITAALLALVWGEVLLFTSPGWFWLLPVLLVLSWWWHLAGWNGLPPKRAVVALTLRSFLLATLVAVLADPRAVRENDGLAVVFAVDYSHSIAPEASDAAFTYVAESIRGKLEGDLAGLVVFGRDAAVEQAPRPTYSFDNAVNALLERDGTDLAKALELSAALIPEDQQGRVVLVSDGTATTGALEPVLADLAARGVSVDVLPVGYDLAAEVWLEKLQLPPRVKAKETYEAAVVLSALGPGTGTLVLRENGQIVAEQEVSYRAGKNRFVLPMRLRGPGYYEYVAAIRVAPDADHWAENNTAIGHLHLEGEGSVLVIRDPEGDDRDHAGLVAALEEAGRAVEVVGSYEAPRDALGLLPYDAVVLVDVPADRFDTIQQRAVRDAVYHMGVGLAVVGGPDSFGPGGYHKSVLEEVLPISMDISQKKVLPKGALAVVLHTCEFPQGNTWGKRVAKQAIKVLGSRDEAGVLVFDWDRGVRWLVPLTPVEQYQQIATAIDGAEIGDMPDFASTMQLGLQGLMASDAAAKHMIIISDGDASPPSDQLLAKYAEQRISVSTVTVFPHGSQDTPVMISVANLTGGRHYYPKSANQLPSIFIKEAKTLKRSMIQNVDYVPEVAWPSPVLKGIEAMPTLHGYVITTLKGDPQAKAVLVRPTEDDDQDPILAEWRFGLGKVATWTADLGPKWAAQWQTWKRYQPFVSQLVTDISRVDRPAHLAVTMGANGSVGEVLIEDHHPRGGLLEFAGRVRTPSGDTIELPVEQVGPGRYRGQFPLAGRGRYQVVLAGSGVEREEQVLDSLVVPFAPEYLRFRSDPITLDRIAERTGGRLLDGEPRADSIFTEGRDPVTASRPIFDWLLLALVIALLIDVGFRRVHIDWATVKGWFVRNDAADSTATMGALLQRKKAVDVSQAPAQIRLPKRPAAPQRRAQRPGKDRPEPLPPKTPAADSGGTMQRLLARKRQLNDAEDDD